MAFLVVGYKCLNEWPTPDSSCGSGAGTYTWLVFFLLFIGGTFFGLLAQVMGAYQGCRAFLRANEICREGGFTGGGYGDPYAGGGGYGDPYSSGGRRYVSGGQVQPSGAPAQTSMQPSAAFTPFGGQGQRLGS